MARINHGDVYAWVDAGQQTSLSPDISHGLVQFIADIRGARVRELEEKRINKEMANIRKKFKGTEAIMLKLFMALTMPIRRQPGRVPEEEVRTNGTSAGLQLTLD